MTINENHNIYRGRTKNGFFKFVIRGRAAIGFGQLCRLEGSELGKEKWGERRKSKFVPDPGDQENKKIRFVGNRSKAVFRFEGMIEYLTKDSCKRSTNIVSKDGNSIKQDDTDEYENEIKRLKIGIENGFPMRMKMDLIVRITGESKSNIYKKIAKGTFPRKQVSKDKGSFWLAEDVFRYMEGNYHESLIKTH